MLHSIQTPVQVIAGRDDQVVPVANAEYLYQHLPNSKLDIVDAGHWVWEEAPEEYAGILNNWWSRSGPGRETTR
ncbi:alpha/beta fold hydrolase [Streptomyces sp. NPDC003233]